MCIHVPAGFLLFTTATAEQSIDRLSRHLRTRSFVALLSECITLSVAAWAVLINSNTSTAARWGGGIAANGTVSIRGAGSTVLTGSIGVLSGSGSGSGSRVNVDAGTLTPILFGTADAGRVDPHLAWLGAPRSTGFQPVSVHRGGSGPPTPSRRTFVSALQASTLCMSAALRRAHAVS
jgi:hypothetical protein